MIFYRCFSLHTALRAGAESGDLREDYGRRRYCSLALAVELLCLGHGTVGFVCSL